ncbi:MAG: tetratricopeptide repeat protein [Leptolyngbya sp. SIO1E4]|nr:tetratricopeptide repeat protein [Leptolyngbya sp. SIO1E4]
MKFSIRLWIVAIMAGVWLLFSQPASASNHQNFDVPSPSDLPQEVVAVSWPKPELASSKAMLMADQAAVPMKQMHDSFSIFKHVEFQTVYRAVMTNPLSAAAWNNLGHQLFSLDHYTEALTAYDHALFIEPDYSLGLANRCGVLSKLGEYAQALVSCELALEKNRHWGIQGAALAWDNRGDALFNLRRYEESLRSFEQALAINPNYQNARRNRAIAQYQLGQVPEHP